MQNSGDPAVYLSTADRMARNFDRRVEVLFPCSRCSLRRPLRFA